MRFKLPNRQLTTLPILLAALLPLIACSSPVAPKASQATVDVLSYLVGDAALWPRVGSHSQNQIVDLARREVCWVKYANARRFDAGPDLGQRDTLLFEYEPYDPAAPQPGAHERFSMALGAGWYRWERSGFVDMFNRLGGPAVAMNRAAWCDAGS